MSKETKCCFRLSIGLDRGIVQFFGDYEKMGEEYERIVAAIASSQPTVEIEGSLNDYLHSLARATILVESIVFFDLTEWYWEGR